MNVFIVGGPVRDDFIEQNPVISRTIEIQGNQTLENLHYGIFGAFEREEEHMYEFQIGGEGQMIQTLNDMVHPRMKMEKHQK